MYTALVILIVLFGLVGIAYLVVFLRVLLRKPTKNSIKTRFFQSLSIGFDKDIIDPLDDVVDIYKGISLVQEEEDYRNNLGLLLRQYLVEIVYKKKKTKKNDQVLSKLSEFIRLNEALAPYADLPTEERTIFNDLSIFIDKKDFESLRRKILELQGTIKARYDDLEKIRSINNLSVPLAIISVILTVFFGIMAWDNPSLGEILQRFIP